MLVVPEKKVLVLRLRDPQRVLAHIPTAKQFDAGGKPYVAVPHRIDEAKVLRNLGFNPPSPMLHHYDWPRGPGIKTPFAAQIESAAFLASYSRAFNLSEMGTGKSLAALWAYDFLRKTCRGKTKKRVLITAPMSTMERTWADEVFKHFPHLTVSVLYGSAPTRHKLLQQEADVYVVNHHGLAIIADALGKRPDIDLVIVDEVAQTARNASTDQWKALNTVINGRRGVQDFKRDAWGLTGTPTPNAPTDAWAQCRLIVPANVTPYRTKFRDEVMSQVATYRWTARENATEIVRQAMQPAIRFTRAECVDLPPLTFETRSVELTAAQTKAYKQMLATLSLESESGKITAVNEAAKMQKLLQIVCGVVRTGEEEQTIEIDARPRIAALKEIIEAAEGKVIVFAPFVSTVRMIADSLAETVSVAVVYGDVKKTERDDIFGAFQEERDPRVIVAQPGAMAHGLTLTKASTIVWYAPITSNDIYEQANGRIHRPGQKLNTFIIRIEGSPLERRLYSRLEAKQKLQGLLLDEVQARRAEVTV